MATTTIDAPIANRPAGFPSRLVPGYHSPNVNVRRKNLVSIASNATFWATPERYETFRSTKRPSWQGFLEAVLPQPATRSQRCTLAIAVLSDFAAIGAGFAGLGFCILFRQQNNLFGVPSYSSLIPLPALSSLLLYGTIFTLLGYSERLYHPETVQRSRQEFLLIAKVLSWSTVLVAGALALSTNHEIPIASLAASAPLTLLLMVAWRSLRRWMSSQSARGGSHARNVLIVGAGNRGPDLASYLERHRPGTCIRGFLDDNEPLGAAVHGRLKDLASVVRQQFVDEIILVTSLENDAAPRIIREARRNHIDLKVVPHFFGFDPAAVKVERIGDIPVLTLCEERIPTFKLLLKRATDVAISILTLVLSGPLLFVISLAIKLDSPGPALYRATRLGRKGRHFQCFKFRTMVSDADQLKEKLRALNERQGAFFKIAGDPRITRVGSILRRYSLDELPQLWNVLRGEMSLVGPRPHPVDDFERYQLEDLQRLEITPGLTGLWQVTARHDPSFERSMSLDREYIGGWNLWMDFMILCKTVLVVLRGEGA
jgi:exopolysaccharide biosynthesis polyprenyl glycosylphosphotransferase